MILSDPLSQLQSLSLDSFTSGSDVQRNHKRPKVASFNLAGEPVFEGQRKYKDQYIWTLESVFTSDDVLLLDEYVDRQPDRAYYLFRDDLLEIKPELILTRSVVSGLRQTPSGAHTGYAQFPVALEVIDDGKFLGYDSMGKLGRVVTLIIYEIRGVSV
jgi:hypothetical protein